jgi:hypothetical protein
MESDLIFCSFLACLPKMPLTTDWELLSYPKTTRTSQDVFATPISQNQCLSRAGTPAVETNARTLQFVYNDTPPSTPILCSSVRFYSLTPRLPTCSMITLCVKMSRSALIVVLLVEIVVLVLVCRCPRLRSYVCVIMMQHVSNEDSV